MASDNKSKTDFVIDELWLIAGIVYVKFVDVDVPYQVCELGTAAPWALVDGNMVPIQLPDPSLLNKYFIYSKKRTDSNNGQVEGKRRGQELWKPIKLADAGSIFYVEDGEEQILAINESDRPWTTKEKVALGVGIGTASVVVAASAVIAAPLAIAGIGFGAGGIAAGSTAAGMMSAGIVGVATLQSIGAAGMGAASILITGATGAAVGGGIAGGTAHVLVPRGTENQDDVIGGLRHKPGQPITTNGRTYLPELIYRRPNAKM